MLNPAKAYLQRFRNFRLYLETFIWSVVAILGFSAIFHFVLEPLRWIEKKRPKKETKWKNVRNYINFASCFSAIAIFWPREKTRDANSQVYLRNATQDSLGAVLLVLQRFANFRELLVDAHEEILHFNFAVHFYVSACSNSTGKLMIDELESGILPRCVLTLAVSTTAAFSLRPRLHEDDVKTKRKVCGVYPIRSSSDKAIGACLHEDDAGTFKDAFVWSDDQVELQTQTQRHLFKQDYIKSKWLLV